MALGLGVLGIWVERIIVQVSSIKVGFKFSVRLVHVCPHSIGVSLQLYSCCSIIQDVRDIHLPFNTSDWPLATSALLPRILLSSLKACFPPCLVRLCGWSTPLFPTSAHHFSVLAGEFGAFGSFWDVLTFFQCIHRRFNSFSTLCASVRMVNESL